MIDFSRLVTHKNVSTSADPDFKMGQKPPLLLLLLSRFSRPRLCDSIDGSPQGSPVPGILQARTLEWLPFPSPMQESEKWKWKSLSRVRLLSTPWTAAFQAPPPMGFSRQEYWSGVPLPSPKNLHSIHLISRWTCSLSESTSRAAVKYLRVGSKYESQQATRWDWLPAAGDCPPRQQGDFQETPSIMSWMVSSPKTCSNPHPYTWASQPVSIQLCLTLCDPMDWSSPGQIPLFHGILQARILEWVTISYSRGSYWPRDQTHISCTGRWILYIWATWEAPPVNVTFFKIRVFANMVKLSRNHESSLSPIWWVAL